MCFQPRCSACARAPPLMARLSLSLPQLVKMISLARQFSTWAMRSRASSRARRARRPTPYTLDGLPQSSSQYGRMASKTRGSTGVVAALSRYTGSAMATLIRF